MNLYPTLILLKHAPLAQSLQQGQAGGGPRNQGLVGVEWFEQVVPPSDQHRQSFQGRSKTNLGKQIKAQVLGIPKPKMGNKGSQEPGRGRNQIGSEEQEQRKGQSKRVQGDQHVLGAAALYLHPGHDRSA